MATLHLTATAAPVVTDLKGYSIEKNEKGGFLVYKDGQLCDNAKGAMREMAELVGLEIDPKWTTQQFGSKLIKAIGEGATVSAPVKKVATTTANKAEAPVKEEKVAKATKTAASSEEDALKARIAELEKELAKQKAAAKEGKPANAEKAAKKSNDPFEGLMVRVCAGMYKQKYVYYNHEYKSFKTKADINNWILFENNRRATISKPFNLCKYPVTQGQWKEIMGEGFNPSEFKVDDNLPVESVTVSEIKQFIEKLNELTGKKYRLPTEAEWQWAASGAAKDSDQGDWAGCSKIEDIDDFAWHKGNSEGTTHPVGMKKPNELGLFDMSGNVYELCIDKVDEKTWKDGFVHSLYSDAIDPCVIDGQYDVIKGGSYNSIVQINRSRTGDRWQPLKGSCSMIDYEIFKGSRSKEIGFRLAETIE